MGKPFKEPVFVDSRSALKSFGTWDWGSVRIELCKQKSSQLSVSIDKIPGSFGNYRFSYSVGKVARGIYGISGLESLPSLLKSQFFGKNKLLECLSVIQELIPASATSASYYRERWAFLLPQANFFGLRFR
ncbi:UNVERIFIED_CONTAM: hypothetical protein Sradi_7250600 [Sesamum radiatum]|uniref:Uncharacterized protein n=1 Tax=Sesamum radiatum TaxID=300843 RepID=A0AAW2IMQ2_SESRA